MEAINWNFVDTTKNSFEKKTNDTVDEMRIRKRPKYSKNKWKFIIYIYGCVVASTTISLSLIGQSKHYDIWLRIMLTIMYSISSSIFLVLVIYIRWNRMKTYEKAMTSSNSSNNEILLSFRGEKISNYLQFGIFIIGSCSIIFTMLRVKEAILSFGCMGYFDMVFRICELLFNLLQTIFIIKFNSVVIIAYSRLTKIAMAQLILTNFSTWIKISMTKISLNFIESKNCEEQMMNNLTWYFLPIMAEFSVISLAILYEMGHRIGKIALIKTNSEVALENNFVNIYTLLPGITISFISVFSTFEVTIYLAILGERISLDILMAIHMLEETCFYLIGIIILLFLFSFTKTLKFTFTYFISSIDINLLYISSFLSIAYCILIITFTFYLKNENTNLPNYKLIISVKSLTAIFESINIIFQTFVIQDCFYRCCERSAIRKKKPGQNYVTILIGINISLWLLKTLQMKRADIFFNSFLINEDIKGKSNPLIHFFLYFTMPLSILFRYHSTVCLADLFTKLYEDESERLECVIRSEGFTINTDDYGVADNQKPFGNRRKTITNLYNARKRIVSSQQWHKKLFSKLKMDSSV